MAYISFIVHTEQDALYRGYKRQLEDLKKKYWQAGLQIKVVQPQFVFIIEDSMGNVTLSYQ